MKTTSLLVSSKSFNLSPLKGVINCILQQELTPGSFDVPTLKQLMGGEQIEVDIKHSSSFRYTASCPMIVSSNFRLEDFADNSVDTGALMSRCVPVHLFAPIAESEEEEERMRQMGKIFVTKPRCKIMPEALIGLYEQFLTEEESVPHAHYGNLDFQTLPLDWSEKFPPRRRVLV